MSSRIEFIKDRLGVSTIEKILDSSQSEIYIEKSISNEEIIIKGAKIASLEIKNSKFKFSISFIECHIQGSITLSNSKFHGELSFINCVVDGDFTIYHGELNNKSFHAIQTKVAGNVLFDGVICHYLELYSLTTNKLTITSSEGESLISKVSIKSSNIDTSTKLFNIDDIQVFEFIDTHSSSLLLKNLKSFTNAKWKVMDSRISDLNAENCQLSSHSVFAVDGCEFTNIGLNNNKYDACEIKIINSLINGVLSITRVEATNTYFDFSSSNSVDIKLDESLTNFVVKKSRDAPLFSYLKDRKQRIGTLKILKSMFANDHDYWSEDRCFYLLKNEEAKDRLENMHAIKKIPNYLIYLISRYIFGWGVKIANPIFATMTFMVAGIIYNYHSLNLSNPSNTIEYLGQSLGGVYAASVLAILSFFGQQADAKLPSTLPPYIFLSEFVLGMVMVTLIVGILIRKLVR